jgi:hypothetical protein
MHVERHFEVVENTEQQRGGGRADFVKSREPRNMANSLDDYNRLAIGVDRSEGAFRGFRSRKTAPRELFGTAVIAKPL